MTSGSFHASYLFQELMILNHDRMINSLVTMYEVLYNGEKMLRGESVLWEQRFFCNIDNAKRNEIGRNE